MKGAYPERTIYSKSCILQNHFLSPIWGCFWELLLMSSLRFFPCPLVSHTQMSRKGGANWTHLRKWGEKKKSKRTKRGICFCLQRKWGGDQYGQGWRVEEWGLFWQAQRITRMLYGTGVVQVSPYLVSQQNLPKVLLQLGHAQGTWYWGIVDYASPGFCDQVHLRS